MLGLIFKLSRFVLKTVPDWLDAKWKREILEYAEDLGNVAVSSFLYLLGEKWKKFTTSFPYYIPILRMFGRVYAVVVTTTNEPPEGHPKAIRAFSFILQISVHRTVFTLPVYGWFVSFPKKKWAQVPSEKILLLPH